MYGGQVREGKGAQGEGVGLPVLQVLGIGVLLQPECCSSAPGLSQVDPPDHTCPAAAQTPHMLTSPAETCSTEAAATLARAAELQARTGPGRSKAAARGRSGKASLLDSVLSEAAASMVTGEALVELLTMKVRLVCL